MLTGERLFKGEDTVQVLSRVLEQPPDLDRVPAKFRKLLARCLDRNAKDRLRDIGEARFLLQEPDSAAASPAAQSESLPHKQSKMPWAVAAVLALVAATVSLVHFRETPPPEQTTRYSITLPESSKVESFAISPDGHTLAIAAAVNGKRQLWLRPMDALQVPADGLTDGATFPFWSPDSRYIGFFAQNKLKKVAASGGPAQSLCDAVNGNGGSWNRDDIILFSLGNSGSSIQRVAAEGGVPIDATKTKGNLKHPAFLPDGRHFLYLVAGTATEVNGVYVSSLDGKENRRILADVSDTVFAPPSRSDRRGHILFVRENTLMAEPFDAASAQPAGDAFPVAEGVPGSSPLTNIFYLPATVSENGVLLYQTGGTAAGENQMGWYDRTGKFLSPVGAPGAVLDPALSPDEKLIVFRRLTGTGSDLWVRDLSRGTEARLHQRSIVQPSAVLVTKG